MNEDRQPSGELEFPSWYDDLAEFEHMHKGYLGGVLLRKKEKAYELTFYDLARLKQDAEEELQNSGFWNVSNLVMVPSVTRAVIVSVTGKLLEGNLDQSFVAVTSD